MTMKRMAGIAGALALAITMIGGGIWCPGANASAAPVVCNGVGTDGTILPITMTPSAQGGQQLVNTEGTKATYSAAFTAFAPVAAATDFINIFGSSTKTIRITRIEVSATTTAATAAVNDLQIIKRSTAGTLGSAVLTAATNIVPFDSLNAAATAVISSVGTANYTTLGTIVGVVDARKFTSQLATATATDFPVVHATVFSFTERNEQGIVLRGTAQQLALNLAGGTVPAGASFNVTITWTEE